MWCRARRPLLKARSIFKEAKSGLKSDPLKYETKDKVVLSDLEKFVVGETICGFEVKEIREINDFKLTALLLVHKNTRSEYLHLYRNDKNNVFSVNLRTTPMNSTGLPHILEHTVLCGSELYPVRDPFFKMLNRSLATFMNAMTGPDFTMYPFSTQNETDYRNLQKIYLDAVFQPQLNELDFMQEGWRLENRDVGDPKSPLYITGVVYNEMKGAFSDNETILTQKLQNSILPDHTYGVISGGDPKNIPDLTWEDLKNFHKNHYHPSNAKFYSYGNFPLVPSLEYINQQYLSKSSYQAPNHTIVPSQKRWSAPKDEHVTGRYENIKGKIETQNSIVVSLAMSDISNVYDTFLMQFVSELLLKGSNAPFYKSLIEPNFSGGYTSCTGYDNQMKDTVFSVGLQGLKKSDFHKVLEQFNKTIDLVVEKGFESKHMESVLHRYELSLKHETSNFGLNLLFGLVPTWNHDGPILTALEINPLIDRLRKEMKDDPKYLQNYVKKMFKDNNHKLVLAMTPDTQYEKKLINEESELINKKVEKLTDEDKLEIFRKNQELQKQQMGEQKVELLPTLGIDDVDTEVERIPLEKLQILTVPTQVNKVNSNGIVYFRGIVSTTVLSQEQKMLLPLFCYVFNKLGTNKLNYKDFDNLAQRKTSGLHFNTHVADSLYQLHSYEPGITLWSYCLERNLEDMWELWRQLFEIQKLDDVNRFKMLVQLYMTNLTQGIPDSGHMYAMQAAASLVSGTAAYKEDLSGLHHISYMKRLLHVSNYPALLREIADIGKILLHRKNLRCCLNILEEKIPEVIPSYSKFIESLPEGPQIPATDKTYVTGKVWAPKNSINCQHHILNIPVNYCSKAILTTPYTEPDFVKLRVLARLLTSKYLHPNLRERYGAYGGGARLSSDGVFQFYSYRDPRNIQTLDVFDESFDWMRKELDKIKPQDIVEAKLGVFQSIDQPIPPSRKGVNEFECGLTPDILQRQRADIMTVNKDDLKEVGEKYFSNESNVLNGKVILGPKENCDTSSRASEMWTVVENV